MKLFGAWLLIFSAHQAPALPPGNSPDTLQILETVRAIQKGIPPSNSANASASVQQHLENFEGLLKSPGKFSANCERFRFLAEQLSSDLRRGIAGLRPQSHEPVSDHEFELGNRIQIEMALFQSIQYLLSQDAEGGFGILDPRDKSSCPFADRSRMKVAATEAVVSLTQYFRARFGSPGLATLDTHQRRLLSLALQDERTENRNFWIYTGTLTIASVVLWEAAPITLLFGVRSIWGVVPRVLLSPPVVYGTRLSALTAEGFTFAYVEELAAHHPEAPNVVLGNWNEYMDSISAVLESPVHAPQLQLVLMSRVHNLVYGDLLEWLKSVAPLIRAEEARFGSLEAAIAFYRGEKGPR